MQARIYIVEDHELVREALGEAIEHMRGLSVCGQAASAEASLEHLAEAEADLVLVDMSLPGMDGAELIGAIRTQWPDLPCLVLSGHEEAAYVERALAAGAHGYLPKRSLTDLEDALRLVLRGEHLAAPL